MAKGRGKEANRGSIACAQIDVAKTKHRRSDPRRMDLLILTSPWFWGVFVVGFVAATWLLATHR